MCRRVSAEQSCPGPYAQAKGKAARPQEWDQGWRKMVSRSPELEASFMGHIWALDSDEDRVKPVSTSCTSLWGLLSLRPSHPGPPGSQFALVSGLESWVGIRVSIFIWYFILPLQAPMCIDPRESEQQDSTLSWISGLPFCNKVRGLLTHPIFPPALDLSAGAGLFILNPPHHIHTTGPWEEGPWSLLWASETLPVCQQHIPGSLEVRGAAEGPEPLDTVPLVWHHGRCPVSGGPSPNQFCLLMCPGLWFQPITLSSPELTKHDTSLLKILSYHPV